MLNEIFNNTKDSMGNAIEALKREIKKVVFD